MVNGCTTTSCYYVDEYGNKYSINEVEKGKEKSTNYRISGDSKQGHIDGDSSKLTIAGDSTGTNLKGDSISTLIAGDSIKNTISGDSEALSHRKMLFKKECK